MSPEQARGESLDRRSDLYALGVILWEILAGRPIHGGLGGEALLDIVRSAIVEPPSVYAPDIPPELEEIVLKALSPERNERYATGRELSAAIGRAIVKQGEGELIDASALEVALAQLTRGTESEPPPPPSEVSGEPARTQVAVPLARSLAGSRAGSVPPSRVSELPPSAEGPREVRHVAVLMLRLQGLAPLALPRRTLDQVRGMLDDLAFKRGMRWVWAGDAKAHAIAGVAANSSRAAADAAQLALDVHEAMAGFKEDLPSAIAASIGIVRGIATGTRDAHGHLFQYALLDPTAYLADVLERATPAGRTWVAGGVYRLVRRDFRWEMRRPFASSPRARSRCLRRCASTPSSAASRGKSGSRRLRPARAIWSAATPRRPTSTPRSTNR
jgi:hypothetical protein